jgi:hypothetical protein
MSNRINFREDRKNKMNKVSRVLGWAFLLQGVTSLVSGMVLEKKWFVEGNISATMTNIANNPGWLRANILVDMLTALGVIFLGAVLYSYLKKHNEKLALTGMAFYILEGALIAAGRMNAFSLLSLSQEWATTGQPASLLTLGNLAYSSGHFAGLVLSMAAFCAGAIPLYYLLVKSRLVPQIISWWGLISVFPCVAGTLITLFGYDAPFALYALYVPFEFFIGIWIIIRGVKTPLFQSKEPVVVK